MLMPEKPKYPLLEALHGKPNKNQEVLVECEIWTKEIS